MIDIIAIVAVGFGAAGILFIFFKLYGRKPPKRLMPLAVGGAMIVFSIYNDYDWPNRAKAALPPEAVIVKEVTTTSFMRPWTFLLPLTEKLILVDTREVQRHSQKDNLALAQSVLMSRYENTRKALHMFDCEAEKRFDLSPESELDADGLPIADEWRVLEEDDPMLKAVCSAPTQ